MTRSLALLGSVIAFLLCAHVVQAEQPEEQDWLLSDKMLARAIDGIMNKARLDRDHDIPYLAGYSEDGKTLYIDRSMPKGFNYNGKFVETDRFLLLHEGVEKALISLFDLRYQFAHQVALRAEMAAVAAAKIKWSAYDRFMQKWIKKIGDEPLTNVPADLDLRPYRDENDADILAKMRDAVDKGETAQPGIPAKAPTKHDKLRVRP
jgi:hypothetical protein